MSLERVRRFWVEFELRAADDVPFGVSLGCGVTAFDRDDALQLLHERLFLHRSLPALRRLIEDVDVSTLDPHVTPNMGNPAERGIWFPLH
jgi:hypothetical protein